MSENNVKLNITPTIKDDDLGFDTIIISGNENSIFTPGILSIKLDKENLKINEDYIISSVGENTVIKFIKLYDKKYNNKEFIINCSVVPETKSIGNQKLKIQFKIYNNNLIPFSVGINNITVINENNIFKITAFPKVQKITGNINILLYLTDLVGNKKVVFDFYNLSGKLIYSADEINISSGENILTVNIDKSKFKTGVYLVKAKIKTDSEDFSDTMILVLVK